MEALLENIRQEFQAPFQNSVLIFSVMLFIILIIPLLLKRLKIPGIIGLIISGILIGPHGFNLIEKNSAVDLFSTIGLLYIMFIAGLDLDLREFHKNRHKSILFGFLTFSVPFGLGLLVCSYFLHFDFYASLLTSSMFATHTLVAYTIVSRLGITKNEAVAVTVGGTIITDTAVLILLAVITNSFREGLTHQIWIRLLLSFLAFLAIVVYIIPPISKWFFKKLEGEKYAHFIYVLATVFFCAFLASLAGLEPIIGAFAAGLTLNKLVPHTSALMRRIDFAGNSLFIPFFLISVGMIIDVRVLAGGTEALVVAGTLTTVAVLGKWLAARITGYLLNYSTAQQQLIFGLSSSHAAATLAVILVGYNLQIIDETVLNGTILLILVTCMVASFVTENAGRKLALQKTQNELQRHDHRNEKILVPVSNPETMNNLVDFAITINDQFYPLLALSVVEDDESAQKKIAEARELLQKAVVHGAESDQKIEVIATIDQNVASGIRRVAREASATDIVLGHSGSHGFLDAIFERTIVRLIETTPQSILLCNLSHPLNVFRDIRLLVPDNSEKEPGFALWSEKLFRLAANLNLKIQLFSSAETCNEFQIQRQQLKSGVPIKHNLFTEWEDFLLLSGHFGTDDLIIFIMPRNGSVSFSPKLEGIPKKLAKHFSAFSFAIIYPHAAGDRSNVFDAEFDPRIIEKGLNQIKKGASDLAKIFRKDE